MAHPSMATEQHGEPAPNRLRPIGFILGFGVVSMLADVVYEGARAVIGPYLATFGASAALVGLITGLGEAAALISRLWTGPLADRTGRYWRLSITGYLITVIAVPTLAAAGALWQSALAIIGERFGKAVRTPARDTMLAHASARIGRGRAFAYHEALDQSGALVGPLLVAAMVALSGYRLAFAVLAVPGALALVALGLLRRAVPAPASYEPETPPAARPGTTGATTTTDAATTMPGTPGTTTSRWRGFSRRYWLYALFTALSVGGYATFAVLSYHLEVRHVVSAPVIPLLYALAMGVDALAALGFGHLYDRIGLAGLAAVPLLTAAIPFLSFSTTPVLVWVGAGVWGAAMGIHESTMRAAVADLVPSSRRGAGYGTFGAVYGLAWLTGSTVIGALYAVALRDVDIFVIALQIAALIVLAVLLRSRASTASTSR